MSDSWTTHFKGTVGGRPVEVKTYDDGGDLRVSTNQGQDHDPSVVSEPGTTVMMPSISKDDPLDIDGATIDEVRAQLAEAGFSAAEAEQIVDHFPN